ncbi:MAG: thiol-disulfide oxidoreductase DCC family protein [Bacteroidota bacterium]|jgi:predicted DCC family thiol-disulfide oxidoreductase YuxK
MSTPQHYIVLFDGVCNFCNAGINRIITHDPKDRFRIAPLQSDIAKELLAPFGIKAENLDSVALIENGKIYQRSTAALRIARRMSGAWPLLFALIIVPPFLRDAVYDWVGRNRYKWWGKSESCMVPTPDVRRKFLNA